MRNPFRYFKSSPQVIRLTVTLYIRYPLSLRQIEDLLFERGIDICHETVRFWSNPFGPMFAAEIRRRRAQSLRAVPQWRWHLDEVFVRISGKTHYPWRAVDHEGEALEVFAMTRRDRKAALAFLRRAMRDIGVERRQVCGRWLNNRAENSHQPFPRRERAMARFRDIKTLQKLASVHASLFNHFHTDHHLNRRNMFKQSRSAALAEWRQLVA